MQVSESKARYSPKNKSPFTGTKLKHRRALYTSTLERKKEKSEQLLYQNEILMEARRWWRRHAYIFKCDSSRENTLAQVGGKNVKKTKKSINKRVDKKEENKIKEKGLRLERHWKT